LTFAESTLEAMRTQGLSEGRIMYFKQFYLGCLAHASYLIGSEGEAAVVDPQRDVDQYINEAEAEGLKIKYVIETHLHADFVSGHRELAERTGAEIVFGEKAGAAFPHRAVKNGDEIRLGKVILRFLETPGHTPESVSILVVDTEVSNEPQKVLTGDTLFIGDVGRPDLAGSRGYTAEQMASMLYDSLHNKLLTLDDATEVYPAHGAGSLCGRNISKETSSTIGQQRRFNYAIQPMSKNEFVRMMTTDLPEAPTYFSKDAEINRRGAAALDELPPPPLLTPEEVNALAREGAVILDVRAAAQFGAGHAPGAINIGLNGQFASWAGNLIKLDAPVVLVGEDDEQISSAVTRLARVGIENVKGYLGGGMYAWDRAGLPVGTIPQIAVDELKHWHDEKRDVQVIDVRQPGEYRNGHVPGAISAPLAHVAEQALSLDPNRQTAVICAGGYRSSAATGILARLGFRNLFNVVGGTSAWINAGYPVEGVETNAICQG
jgi:glyoxylase-like metal-dependent hydrolase (beta-lactamase superfamily II)/rhodanese-related sulfurtransferase